MRIAAGVLLIIAGILNLFAGLGYVGGGAAASVGTEAVAEAAKQQAAEGKTELTAEQQAELEKAADEGAAVGGGLMIFGVFLIVMLGLQIAGAVVLFQQKAATFALVVSVLSIVAEVGGILIVAFGVMNIIGLVAGALGIVAARSYAKA